jgi:hypothetical protein
VAINFLHANGEDYFVAATRNAWVGNLVYWCVLWRTNMHRAVDDEGAAALNGGLRNRTMEGKIKSKIGEQCKQVFFF